MRTRPGWLPALFLAITMGIAGGEPQVAGVPQDWDQQAAILSEMSALESFRASDPRAIPRLLVETQARRPTVRATSENSPQYASLPAATGQSTIAQAPAQDLVAQAVQAQGAPGAGARLSEYLKEPPVAKEGFQFLPTMSMGPAIGTIWRYIPGANTVGIKIAAPSDVEQGNIGSCGFGAAVLTTYLLKGTFTIRIVTGAQLGLTAGTDKRPVFFDVPLFNPFTGQTVVVHMTDKLPASSPGQGYLGYVPQPDGTGKVILAVSYLEKAFAKLMDIEPRFKSQSGKSLSGYDAMDGISPCYVMQALNNARSCKGGARSSLGSGRRLLAAPAASYAQAVSACWASSTPCVIGTPKVEDLPQLGGWDAATRTSTLDGVTLTVIEASQLPDGPEPGSGYAYKLQVKDFPQPFYLVPNHWYGVMKPYGSGFGRDMTLANPWGQNPGSTALDSYLFIPVSVMAQVTDDVRYL